MPLNLAVEHKAIIGVLRDFESIIYELNCDTSKRISFSDSLRDIYPSDFDLENDDAEELKLSEYNGGFFSVYKKLSNKLFMVYNGKIFIKKERLSDYHLYSTALDLYPSFSLYLLEKSQELLDYTHRLNYLTTYLDETFRFYGNLETKIKEISEVHAHLGAMLDFHYHIHDILSYPDEQNLRDDENNVYFPKEVFISKYKTIQSKSFFLAFSLIESYVLHYFISMEENVLLDLNKINTLLLSIITKTDENSHINTELKILLDKYLSVRNDDKFFEKNYDFDDEIDEKLILNTAAYFNKESEKYNPKLGDKTLVLFFMNKFKNLSIDNPIYLLLSLYLSMRNITKTILVQQHRKVGFGYFKSYSKSKFKKRSKYHSDFNVKEILSSTVHPKIPTNIEGRSAIFDEQGIRKQIIIFHNELRKLNLDKKENFYNFKLIYHFLKSKDEAEQLRYQILKKQYKKQAQFISNFLTSPNLRFYNEEEIDFDGEDKKYGQLPIDLAKKYIQGIDAASSENLTPPEAFSGVYSYFKNSIVSSGYAISDGECSYTPSELNLQYTFHVGEEFRDINSGVRAIYEAVLFLNLKDEDRIGHAVALGIDPKIFLNDRRKVTLSKGEHFDNLVFLYYLFSQRDDTPISMEILKNRINQIAFEIYERHHVDSYSIDDYIDAWLLRRNCVQELSNIYNAFFDKTGIPEVNAIVDTRDELFEDITLTALDWNSYDKAFARFALPDFFNLYEEDEEPTSRYLTAKNNSKALKIYWAYNTDYKVQKKYNETYMGKVEFLPEVYTYLQDIVMEELIAKKDIIIEVLPTSNVLITSIGSFENHPLIRFKPPKEIIPNDFGIRKSKIKIIVGTDDPGIQGTNLMMEFYHIKHLVTQKYDKTIAEKYILDIIEQGNYIFHKS